jgi:hypothetical protein
MCRRHVAACVLGLLYGCTACARPSFAPPGINISSERSDYAPTARLAVALAPLHMNGDTVEIVIDSGSVAVPGDVSGGEGGTMFSVYLTALLVTPVQGRTHEASTNPWEAVAQSDSQLVVASIPRGERRALGTLRFRVPRPRDLDPARAWVVFRLTGNVIPHTARMVGQPSISPLRTRRFRVYACADWNLTARIDRKRSKVMNASYLKAC